ncbi:MAG: phosphotransferase [Candidatus Nanoarchaeia archaeon]|nr:phosphotransferase [Candidatus Nanoarchaeia archaeon]
MKTEEINKDFEETTHMKSRKIYPREKTTNNPIYFVETDNEIYIYKKTPKANKEKKVYSLLYETNFFPIFENTYFGEDYLIQKYEKNALYMNPELRLEDLIKRQNFMMQNRIPELDEELYYNSAPERIFIRLKKHNFYFGNKENILKFLREREGFREKVPKLFLHGDLIEGNVLLTPNGIKYIDFERAMFDRMSWELGPILFRSNVEEVPNLIKFYVKNSDCNGQDLENAVHYDFVTYLCTFGISVEQSLIKGTRRDNYLSRISEQLRGMNL